MRTAKILLHTMVGISMVFYTLAVGLLAVPSIANAQTVGVPATIGYNGRLFNASGSALTGTYYIWFDLEPALTGGTNLGANIQAFADADGDGVVDAGETAITVTNGFFTVEIPITTDVADFVNNIWLEIKVHTADVVGSAETLAPRVKVTKTPYSIFTQGIQNSSADPTTAFAGEVYYDTDTNDIKYYNGTSFLQLASDLDTAYNNFGTSAQIITIDDATTGLSLDVAAAGNLDVDLQSTGDFNVQDAGSTWAFFSDAQAFDVDGTGAISLDADAASNFNTSAGDLTLSSEAASTIIRGVEAVADAVLIDANNNAAGGIDMDAGTGGVAIDSTGAISLDGAAASNFTTSVGDLTASSTAGSVVIIGAEAVADAINIDSSNAAGGIDMDSGTGGTAIDSTGAVSIDGAAASNLSTSVGALTLSTSAGGTASSVIIRSVDTSSDAIYLDADGAAGAGITLDAYDATNNTTGAIITNSAYYELNTFNSNGTGSSGFDVNVGDSGTLSLSTTDGAVSIDGGGSSGTVNLTSAQSDITMDTQTASRTISIGTSNVARTINVGSGTGADVVNIGAGADQFNFVSTENTNDAMDITFDSITSANGIDYTVDALTSGNAWQMTNTGTFSGNLYNTATTGAWTGQVWNFDDTGNAAWTGNVFQIATGTGDHTGDIMNVSLEATTASDGQVFVVSNADTSDNAGWLLDLDTSAAWTGIAMDVDFGAGVSTGNFLDVTYATAAHSGNAIDLNMGTNLAGNAIDVQGAGIRTAPLIFINGDNTDGGTDDHVIDIDQDGLLNSNVLDITFATAASDGNAIDLNMGTNLAGDALNIVSAATSGSGITVAASAITSGDLLYLNNSGGDRAGGAVFQIDDASDATASGPSVDWNASGVSDQNFLDLTYSAAATGNAIDLNMGSNVAGDAINIATAGTSGQVLDVAATGILTADLISISSTGATITTGVDGLSLAFATGDGATPTNNMFSGSLTSGGTATGDLARGLYLDLASTAGGTDTAIFIDNTAAWDVDVSYQNDTTLTNTSTNDLDFADNGVTLNLDFAEATAATIQYSSASSLDFVSTAAAADAILIEARTAAGGIDIFSEADIDITTTGAAGEDITITNTGGSVLITATESIAGAILLDANDGAAGGIDADAGTGGLDVDTTGRIDLTSTLNDATGNGSIYLHANGGANEGILLHADQGTTVTSIEVRSDVGGLTLDSGLASADAININASNAAGGIDVDYGTGNLVIVGTGAGADMTIDTDLFSIDGTGTSNVTVTGGAGEDFTVAQAGAADNSLILSSTGTAADALQITTSAGGIDITNAGAAGGEDLDIRSTAASVRILGAEAVADAIVLNAHVALGGIDIFSEADIDITTTGAAGEDITITNTGGSVLISATESVAGAILLQANTTAGGLDVDAGTSGFDLDSTGRVDLTSTLNDATGNGSIYLHANGGTNEGILLHADQGTTATSIELRSDVGGIFLTTALSSATALDINTTAGGMAFDATGTAGEDISITNTGASINLVATESIANAIFLDANNGAAGGIDADAGTGGLDVDTTGRIDLTSTLNDATGNGSIYLHANGGTNEGILIHADQGTTATSIELRSDVGGINITVFDTANGGNDDFVMQVGDAAPAITADGNDINLLAEGHFLVDTADFDVNGSGAVTLNLSTTPTTAGLCHSGADQDNGTDANRTVVACSAAPDDFAEWYPAEANVTHGNVVALGETSFTYSAQQSDPFTGQILPGTISKTLPVMKLATSNDGVKVFGIVSTSPIQTIGSNVKEQAEHPMPIALSGRVPLKVTNENGLVSVGDYLSASSTPGYAMKATANSQVIAIALSAQAGGTGTVNAFVKNFFWDGSYPTASNDLQGGNNSTDLLTSGAVSSETLTVTGDASFEGSVTVAEHLYGSRDMAGRARLNGGASEVRVSFETEYAHLPIVTFSVRSESLIPGRLWVSDESTTGFTINHSAGSTTADTIELNWIAIGVEEAIVSISDGTTEELEVVVTSDSAAEAAVQLIENATSSSSAEEAVSEEATEEVVAEEIAEDAVEEVVEEVVAEETTTEEVVVEEAAAEEVAEEVVTEVAVEETAAEETADDAAVEDAPVVEEASTEVAAE